MNSAPMPHNAKLTGEPKSTMERTMTTEPKDQATTDAGSSGRALGYAHNVGAMKRLLSEYEDDQPLIGNATDGEGNWFAWPIRVAKVPGNNRFVVIDLRPLDEE